MSKRAAKNCSQIGVGQLVLQIDFLDGETSDAAGETEVNEPQASAKSSHSSSKSGRQRKWYSLIDKVYALPNLAKAWLHVKENMGAPGIDGVTIGKFSDGVLLRLEHLSTDLRQTTYRPQPVRRKLIPKSGGGTRPLGIPTVRDRVVQQALLQVLEPIFDAKFSKRSHGFRKNLGCATALSVVDKAVRHGYEWVVDADIRAFFDTVSHEKLLSAVHEEISDGSILRLIRQILEAGVIEGSVGDIEPTTLGTPQGGPISPLLANIYLHAFDVRMEEAGIGLVRYADDFVLFTKSKQEAEQALLLARQILEGEWGLSLHPEKTRVVSVTEGFEFLGFHYYRDLENGSMMKEVRRKSVQRFRDAIRSRTPRLKTQRRVKEHKVTLGRLRKNKRLRAMIASVNSQLRGWQGYFRAVWSKYPDTPFRNFDSFVRSRVRTAITGRVGSGWWHIRLSNQVLSQLGLVSLDKLQRQYRVGQQTAAARKG